ncbi:unnamed protein product [Cyclocybe aegerita]|uniref:Uncharacterized protein n=1 Tax=Cyclocybe aegerita TaxID=1973307 RepID=A0A8S0WPM3_CYCAE|nr:unnamed protein product [Cyclocybe aegerita]
MLLIVVFHHHSSAAIPCPLAIQPPKPVSQVPATSWMTSSVNTPPLDVGLAPRLTHPPTPVAQRGEDDNGVTTTTGGNHDGQAPMGSAHRAVDPGVHSGQAFSLSVCRALQEWFEADDLRRITFVYVPSAMRWDIHGEAHKYVTELKVRVGRRKTDNSIDALRSRAAHSVLDSWSSTFQDPTYRGSEFLELQQPDGRPLQPSYLNGGPWLSTFGHSITEFARVCRCITGHAPIGAYYRRFKINEPHGCTCGAALQSRQHILFRCRDRYSVHYPRFLGDIASFMKYNPTAFGFNRDPSGVG